MQYVGARRSRATKQMSLVQRPGRKLHKDWRVWLALLLMLAAILMYVLSLDDSIIPR
jgi:hypothetical protein